MNDTLHTFESSLLHLLPFGEGASAVPASASEGNCSFGEGWVLNDPFHYEPHPLCRLAAEAVQRYIYNKVEWSEEMARGKMFGVLVVEGGHYLAAYSGQILGRGDWEGFVPPVFDYLQPNGYFKTEERAIEQINQRIAELKSSPERQLLRRRFTERQQEQEQELARWQAVMDASKRLRQKQREEGHLSEQQREELVRESQFQKAELRRKRQRYAEEINLQQQPLARFNSDIAALEHERKQRSRALQQWLFSHFEMVNDRGERRSLLDIFSETSFQTPPSGAGECCEPKLLQYAFAHGLKPLAIAMFWFGGHPEAELRRHGHFYPACSGKCKPILRWMLQRGAGSEERGAGSEERGAGSEECGVRSEECGVRSEERLEPEVLFEDDALLVINKPAGLLTVPGIATHYSVFSIFRKRYPDLDSPLIVHRLDQATSGLLVLAKTRPVYVALQRQFMERTIEKHYVALVSKVPAQREGTISLPMRPDYFDRPRQIIDREQGKSAVTEYRVREVRGTTAVVDLHPLTGRTHQLRVHCAHPEGLDAPIVGDELYGTRADRMYLHAERLVFTHPLTGRRMTFFCPFSSHRHD